MNVRDQYVAKWQAKLDELNAMIDLLEAKARKSKAGTTAGYREQMAALKTKRDEAEEQFRQIQSASLDAWENVTADAARVWDDLEESVEVTQNALSAPT